MRLTLEGVGCAYGEVQVLREVSFQVAGGEIVGLVGRNGAGKTTILRAIMGLLRPRAGRITLDGQDLGRLRPHAIPRLGLAYVPQGRRLFPFLTVDENLRMGLLVRGGGQETLAPVLELFPVLRERLRQQAGTLSGGQQQMLATARALCARPEMLLLDEPSEGLMPGLVERLLDTIVGLRARGVGVLLVEQRVDAVLRVADRVVVLENGRVACEATPAALAAAPEVLLQHLGVRRQAGGAGSEGAGSFHPTDRRAD
jgi:branched-chain amino acid transport system ATP-binding protein